MSKILSTEKNPFIQKNIEIYSKNKVGQFSKYLDLSPVYGTYFSINQTMTRSDVGSGSVSDKIGKRSPIRYNMIEEMPFWNVPDFKPEIQNDEDQGGMDINMDFSGMVIAPNTVKPHPDDFIYIRYQGMPGLLIQITDFEYNTIQSNDFYIINGSLWDVVYDESIGEYGDLINQVVEKYHCIFENIGTQDKCLVRNDAYDWANQLRAFIDEMRDSYYDIYYQPDVGTFAAVTSDILSHPVYFYDLYLVKFIKESGIFQDDERNRSVYLNYDDSLPMNFDSTYRKTLWWAVKNCSNKYLVPYSFFMTGAPISAVSVFRYCNMETQVSRLYLYNAEPTYSSSRFIGGLTKEYFPTSLTSSLVFDQPFEASGYYDQIIYNYIKGIKEPIDTNHLLDTNMEPSISNYLLIPLIIYILTQEYRKIFQ